MHGILLRPASHAADTRQRDDHVEVRWRIRPPTPPRQSSGGRGRRPGQAGKETEERMRWSPPQSGRPARRNCRCRDGYQPRARHSGTCGRSTPSVVSLP